METEKETEETKPAHTCDFATLKNDANNHWYVCSCGNTSGKGAHGYTDEYDATCNTCGYTRSVPEKPVEPSDDKKEINWTGGSITLPTIGADIPTLPHFNDAGLVGGDGSWWDGNTNSQAGMNSIYYNCDKVTNTLLSNGIMETDASNFSVGQTFIYWNWLGAGNAQDMELVRLPEKGYYKLTLNCSLKDHMVGEQQVALYNKDILTVLCSFISIEPQKLSSGITEDMIGTTFISESGWTTIGDCKVQYDDTNSYKGHFVYKIKGK